MRFSLLDFLVIGYLFAATPAAALAQSQLTQPISIFSYAQLPPGEQNAQENNPSK